MSVADKTREITEININDENVRRLGKHKPLLRFLRSALTFACAAKVRNKYL